MDRKGSALGVGAIVSGVLASACCIGPAILAGFGLGGAAFAAALAPYRPYFLALTALILGAAFFVAYRPRKAEGCGPGGTCSVPASRRRARLFLWIVTLFAVGAAAFPYLARARAPRESAAARFPSRAVVLDLEGMTCPACATHIERSLETVPGVLSATVSYEERQATVTLSSRGPDEAALVAAVREAGYSASVRERGGLSSGANP